MRHARNTLTLCAALGMLVLSGCSSDDAGASPETSSTTTPTPSTSNGDDFSRIAPVVADSGEGRWTALESIELGVPAPVITLALMNRFSSQGGSSYARRLLAMMRGGFGGHPVQKLP